VPNTQPACHTARVATTCAGALQFLMKEHDKAMITYKQGLEHDPNNQELKEGVESCIRAISR